MRKSAAAPNALMVCQMLAREQLGRRHQRGLRAGLDGGGHGEQRDNGLAAADIALQQTQHALRFARSASISASARFCAPVSLKGRALRIASCAAYPFQRGAARHAA